MNRPYVKVLQMYAVEINSNQNLTESVGRYFKSLHGKSFTPPPPSPQHTHTQPARQSIVSAAIFNHWIVVHIQSQGWPAVERHSEDAPENNSCSRFPSVFTRKRSVLTLFLFYDTHSPESSLNLSLLITFTIGSVNPIPPGFCFILFFFGGRGVGGFTVYTFLVTQSPPQRTSVSAYLKSVQRTLVAVTGAHCYFGSSMCLSKRGSGFLVLQRDSTLFGLQRSHDGW